MIITILNFGLGNQMFQYATAKAIAKRRQDDLVLEISSFGQGRNGSPVRKYSLACFNVNAKACTWEELRKNRYIPHVLFTLRETSIGFHKEALVELPSNYDPIVLVGSWQSESYFKEVEQELRDEFSFKGRSEWNSPFASQIKNSCAVCLHVRRGDYISSSLGSHLGFVGLDYYQRAVAKVLELVKEPHFFIFSDDIEWCKSTLEIDWRHTFICHSRPPDQCDIEDMYLMTLCRHFIIANSTFSWWGAWLGSYCNKIVIAPQRWFSRTAAGDVESMLPSEWIRL
jgi:hypothetical protein